MHELSTAKQSLYQRIRPSEGERIQPSYFGENWIGTCLRCVVRVLSTIGITFPVLYLIPNPLKKTFARQGFLNLPPNTTFRWHFEATKAAVLVLRTIEFEPLDAGSTNILDFFWTVPQAGGSGGASDTAGAVGQENKSRLTNESGGVPDNTLNGPVGGGGGGETTLGTATGSLADGAFPVGKHGGLSKPVLLVIDPREVVDLILRNQSNLAPAFVKFEIQGWFL